MNAINLLPLQQQPMRIKIQQAKRFLYIYLGSVTVFILIGCFFYQAKIFAVNQEANLLQVQQKNHTHQFERANQLRKEIKYYQEQINRIEVSQDESARLKEFLHELPKIIPEQLYLLNLSWHEHSGIIYGQAMSNNDVIQFMQILKNNIHFKKFNLIKSDRRHEQDHMPPIYFVIHFYAQN